MAIPLHKAPYCLYCGRYAKGWDHVVPVSIAKKMEARGERQLELVVRCCIGCNIKASDNLFETLGERVDFVQMKLQEEGVPWELPKVSPELRSVRVVGMNYLQTELVEGSSVLKNADMSSIRDFARKRQQEKLEQKHLTSLQCKPCGRTWREYSENINRCSRNFCPLMADIIQANVNISRELRSLDKRILK